MADVLFGLKPFTGRLPLTWAKAESQLPINVGDANYDPLYPFGWGLRTDNPRARLQTLRDQLETQRGSGGGGQGFEHRAGAQELDVGGYAEERRQDAGPAEDGWRPS